MDADYHFRINLRRSFESFVRAQSGRFSSDETLRIDLHCHDLNSSLPDHQVGRLLRTRETWITTEEVLRRVQQSKMDLPTITNHNNARSCWTALDKGIDILVGTEFTCFIPEYDIYIHVLAYGFTPQQEVALNTLRRNLYEFIDYTQSNGIPTSWAHPLYFYGMSSLPPITFFEKMSLVFDCFEVINGHRDSWQNLLFATWLESLDPEHIDDMAKRAGFAPDRFARRPYDKAMTGGSDCHMGLMIGSAGVRLQVPDLARRRADNSLADLAKEALWEGRTAPFGRYCDSRQIAAAFLDYYCQAQMHLEDPGLLRLFLDKGSTAKKLQAFMTANAILELRRHKNTSRFVQTAHDALHGRKPGFFTRIAIKREYRPIIDTLNTIATAHHKDIETYEKAVEEGIPAIFNTLSKVLSSRIRGKLESLRMFSRNEPFHLEQWLDRLELPAHLRTLFSSKDTRSHLSQDQKSLSKRVGGLHLPLLASALIATGRFSGARVMHENRPILEAFAKRVGKFQAPKRALWLTDTLFDKNGVSKSIELRYREVSERNLPIDFMTCGDPAKSTPHLHILETLEAIEIPFYREYKLRLFDLLDIQQRFVEGSYDRIVCSTELLMGPVALYLKKAFNVPAYFFLHTDWLTFARDTLGLNTQLMDQLRRLLSAFYRQFDGIFVLNSDQAERLASEEMGIPRERIHLTSHWVDEVFQPRAVLRESVLPKVAPDIPVILYAGRLSIEKGVLELPEILKHVRSRFPEAKMVFAGSGPIQEKLQEAIPDAIFTGWVEKERLAELYNVADVCVLPSRFDTFCRAVLEAQRCGLPVVAYGTMGPKDLIRDGQSGFLVDTPEAMSQRVIELIESPSLAARMSASAQKSASRYTPDKVLAQNLEQLGLPPMSPPSYNENAEVHRAYYPKKEVATR